MPEKGKRIYVVGAGPAGMMAASKAAEGANTVLIDKNEKAGKKLYITGKGRCNVTNACDIEDFFLNIPRNSSFCYSAIYSFTPDDTVALIENNGTPLKTERGNRVFPVSDKSADIIKALEKNLKASGAQFFTKTRFDGVIVADNKVTGIKYNGSVHPADGVILALGGASYTSTGSDGKWKEKIEKLGIKVNEFSPALVPLKSEEQWVRDLQGLSLKNVKIKATCKKRTVYEQQGEMLFTHFGISGPLILTLSSMLNKKDFSDLKISLDLKPALTFDVLDARLQREFTGAKTLKNAFTALLPSRLVNTVLSLAQIDGEQKVSTVTALQRKKLVEQLKNTEIPVSGFGELNEAIVTRGGVDVKEIDPSTMESKKIKGLYFAGEMIDIDALTGGFNIQLALSTGFIAGSAAGGTL